MTYKDLIMEIDKFDEEIRDDVKNINFTIDGIKPLGCNCVSVSMSTLMKNNNWDPSFYNVTSQKNKLLNEVSSSTNLKSLITKLNKICDKRTFSDGSRINPKLAVKLEELLNNKGCRNVSTAM